MVGIIIVEFILLTRLVIEWNYFISFAFKIICKYEWQHLSNSSLHYVQGIPFEFIEKHLKPDTENVILQVADRLWVTKLSVNKLHRIAKLTSGWTEFAKENSLKVGDVCVFKMIASRDAAMLNVTISRIDG